VLLLFRQWERLRELYAVKQSLPPMATTLLDVFAAARAANATLGNVLSVLAAATGWARSDLDAACGPTGFNLTPRPFANAAALPSIGSALALGRRLGVPVAQLVAWATSIPDAAQATSVKAAVRARYDDATWLQIAAPIADDLRERQRAALIAYVLQQPTI